MNPVEIFDIPLEERKLKKLSILMPFLNEEGVIVNNVKKTIEIMDRLDYNYEIILIDDGSRDKSFELLKTEFSNSDFIKIVRNYQNFGKGWALKTGYEYSSGDYILFLDSDLELSPLHISNFYRVMLENEADAVIGSKLHPDSIVNYPLTRRIISLTYYLVIKILFGLPVMDTQTGIKLFRRSALELSLPKVLVKKFAFDIELLIILNKNRKIIVSAPVDLQYTRINFGNIKTSSVISTFIDTLAVFYRDRILRFYDRPMGTNIKYFYTIAVFPSLGDSYEKEALERYLRIKYSPYEVICVGETYFGIKNPCLKYIECSKLTFMEKIGLLVTSGLVKGDYIVFSDLDTYPDERFLFTAGRILSIPEVGAAGGYVVARNGRSKFEDLSFRIISSYFLNLNLSYRYKPINFKEVGELQFEGLFMKYNLVKNMNFDKVKLLLPAYAFSREILNNGLKLIYSPDITLYKRFPENSRDLFSAIRNDAESRATQFMSRTYKKNRIIDDRKFLLPLILLILIPVLIILSIVFRNPFIFIPVPLYYLLLLASSIITKGLAKGFIIFYYISILQVYYGMIFLAGLFKNKNTAR